MRAHCWHAQAHTAHTGQSGSTSAEKDARGSATLAPPARYRPEVGVWAGLGVGDSRQVPFIGRPCRREFLSSGALRGRQVA